MDNGDVMTPGSVGDTHVFRKSVPLQDTLHELLRATGDTTGQTCLDIGCENGMLNRLLRRNGGEWFSVAAGPAEAQSLKAVTGQEVYAMDGLQLPFKKKSFDKVVVINYLESVASDAGFIEECHRVLKPNGRLIVHVTHVKAWSLVGMVQRLVGLTPENRGRVRAGYTESELFAILKNGFDVRAMRSYSRFWVELVDALVGFALRRGGPAQDPGDKRRMRIYSIASPFYKVADQLDLLAFFTRGHYLIASANWRMWRSREAPILVDGRSISEAVLSKARD